MASDFSWGYSAGKYQKLFERRNGEKMSADDQIKNYQDLLRQYNILNQLSRTVSSTLDLNKILRIILTGTFGDGFGLGLFFLIDREEKKLLGRMAIGPSSNEEAWKVWGEIQQSSFLLRNTLILKNSIPRPEYRAG